MFEPDVALVASCRYLWLSSHWWNWTTFRRAPFMKSVGCGRLLLVNHSPFPWTDACIRTAPNCTHPFSFPPAERRDGVGSTLALYLGGSGFSSRLGDCLYWYIFHVGVHGTSIRLAGHEGRCVPVWITEMIFTKFGMNMLLVGIHPALYILLQSARARTSERGAPLMVLKLYVFESQKWLLGYHSPHKCVVVYCSLIGSGKTCNFV
jgi:hypothetical protein